MSPRLTAVEARSGFRIWMRFADGTEGEADLSDVAGRGVFRRWTDHPQEFAQVRIDPISGAPTWPGDLDVAPDRLYEEVLSSSKRVQSGYD